MVKQFSFSEPFKKHQAVDNGLRRLLTRTNQSIGEGSDFFLLVVNYKSVLISFSLLFLFLCPELGLMLI